MKNKSAIVTPVLLIVIYLFLAAVRLIPDGVLGVDENPYFAVVILQLLIYVVPALFYCRIRQKGFVKRLRVRLPRPGHILLLVYAVLFLVSGNALISMGMYHLMPERFVEASAVNNASFAMNSGVFDGLYVAVAFAVLPAVTEELVFRGIVIGEYENYGPGFAIVMSALTFGMSHFDFARLPVYLFSGIVLALVLYATRSLAASMLIHSLNNLSILFLERYLIHIADKQNISMLLFIIILASVALLSLLLFCGEAAGIYKGYAHEALTVDYGKENGRGLLPRIAEAYFSPTFLVLVVIFITFTVSW